MADDFVVTGETTLGQEYFVTDSPKLSLVANEKWCSGIRVDKDRGKSSSVTVSEFFHKSQGASALKGRTPTVVVEHFDAVTFLKKNGEAAAENRFGFLIDNKKEKDEYAMAYIYSHQDKKMIFDGFVVPPGEESRLVRYDTDDQAFCLMTNPMELELTEKKTACDIFEDVQRNKKDVCAFSIIVTRAKARNPIPLRGLLVETDGIPSKTDQTDGTPHYTNLVKGGKTNQKFKRVEVDYEGAPVHIYNVVLFMV